MIPWSHHLDLWVSVCLNSKCICQIDCLFIVTAEKMLSGHGKNPLVAATYYFNPSNLLRTEGQQHDNTHDSKNIPFHSPSNEFVKNNNIHHSTVDDDGYCTAPDSRKGVCYDAKECVSRGGTPMGSCSSTTSSNSGSLSSSSSSQASKEGSVCCLCKFCQDL